MPNNGCKHISEDYEFLYVKSEVHDVAVLHDIFFSFYSESSCVSYSRFASILYVVIVFDNFCSYKAFFKVGVYYSGALWCLCKANNLFLIH